MADSAQSGSTLYNVTGSFPFTNIHVLQVARSGSFMSDPALSGSFPLSGITSHVENFVGHTVDMYTSGVVEQVTIETHTAGIPFYVKREILVVSGILSS